MINLNDPSTFYNVTDPRVSKSYFNQNAQNQDVLNQKNQNILNILDVYFNQNATKINDLYKKVNDLEKKLNQQQKQ